MLSQWNDSEPLNFGPKRAGSLQTRLVGPSIPEPTGTAGSVYFQPLGVRDGRLHDARHTAATDLLLLGVHERTIMSVLGWSTTAMASRYTHVITPIHDDLGQPASTGSCGPAADQTRSVTN